MNAYQTQEFGDSANTLSLRFLREFLIFPLLKEAEVYDF